MTQSKHRYRVSIYLGKELYEELEKSANMMGISVATLARILLNTGNELSKTLERRVLDGVK